MNRQIVLRAGILGLALVATGLSIMPVSAHAQTPGMERRQGRRQNRDDARETRQQGRHEGRDNKQACRDAGGNPMECRHTKRQTKQKARQDSRDVRMGGDGQ